MGKYDFLFRVSSLPNGHLAALIATDEFIRAADDITALGRSLSDMDIYNIAETLYFPMLAECQEQDFKAKYKARYGNSAYKEWSYRYRTFGKATRRFSRALFGDERWRADYEAWLFAHTNQ